MSSLKRRLRSSVVVYATACKQPRKPRQAFGHQINYLIKSLMLSQSSVMLPLNPTRKQPKRLTYHRAADGKSTGNYGKR
jgi:hypothetical protein